MSSPAVVTTTISSCIPFAEKACEFFTTAGGRYYYTVDNTALVAFSVGPNYIPGNGGFKIICGHTDSPNLRVKPKSKRTNGTGLIQLGVETYVRMKIF